MKHLSPALGYALKGIYRPLEMIARFRQLTSPLSGDVSITRNLSYGSHTMQTCDVLYPTSPSSHLRPVVLIVHGGSWVAGDKILLSAASQYIAMQGFVVVNMNYRLAPQFPYIKQIQDVSLCLKWVAHHIGDFGGSRNQIFLLGETSGANLVTAYATALSYPYLRNTYQIPYCLPTEALKGVLSFYGIFDLDRGILANVPFISHFYEAFLGSSQDKITEMIDIASPLRFAHKNLPPFFLASGENDPLFTQSVLFARKLRSIDHPYVTTFLQKEQYPDAQHLFFYLQNKTTNKTLADGVQFMKHYGLPNRSQRTTSTAVA
jgi:acetyl esterase/lipase